MKENEFQCAYCGGIFEKGFTDEECEQEAKDNFGKPIEEWNDEAVLICGDCYKLMIPSEHPEELKRCKEIL